VAPLALDEYGVLTPGLDECTNLIPRAEQIISRLKRIGLDCAIGIARCPLDAEALTDLVAMSGLAATEATSIPDRYQFISRRHRFER
jgi:hypothetical protein